MKQSNKVDRALLYIITFFIHMSVAYWVRTLNVLGDEMGVAAIAAYLAGEDWSTVVKALPYYGFGQAVFYVPVFLVTKAPEIRYLLMGAVNSVWLAAIPLLVYQILGRIQALSSQECFWYSLTVGLFTPYLVYTKWIWNETLLCVLPWILLLLLIRCIENRRNNVIESAAIAFVSVYCYAVHGRGILYIGVVLLTIIYLYARYKIKAVNLPSFVISFTGSYLIYNAVKAFLMNNLWKYTAEGAIGNTLGAALPNLIKLISEEGITQFLTMAAGHLMSAILSSYGMLVLAAVFVIHPKAKEFRTYPSYPQEDRMTLHVIGAFSILCFAGALFIDLAFLIGQVGDYLIYTRYYAGTLGFTVLWAILIIRDKLFVEKFWKNALITFLCCVPMYFVILSDVGFGRKTVFMNLYPYLTSAEPIALLWACYIIFGIFMLFLVVTKSKYRRFNVLILLCVFLEAYYFCGAYIIPGGIEKVQSIQGQVEAPAQVLNEIDDLPQHYPSVIFFDLSWWWDRFNLQYVLPEYQVNNASKTTPIEKSVAKNSFFVSQSDMDFDYMYCDIYRINDPRLNINGNYMWAYGNDLIKYIEDHSSCQMSNHCGEPWSIDLNRFSTTAGIRGEDGIISSGNEGGLIYGPYMSLASGDYTVTITGQLISGTLDSCSFDATYDGGTQWFTGVKDLQQFLDGDYLNLQVDFMVVTDAIDCEFRIFVDSSVELEINSVTLQKHI